MDSECRYATLTALPQATRRNAILVNVGAMGSARRFVDFTMPGAQAYNRFLTRELIPYVEARYRVDAGRRTLSGHSLSGQFAVYALGLEQPEARFSNGFLSGDGSFWYTPDGPFHAALDEPTGLVQAMRDRGRQLPVSLFPGGSFGGNAVPGTTLRDFLAQRGYEGLRLRNVNDTLGHVPMDGPSFAEGLEFLYGPPG